MSMSKDNINKEDLLRNDSSDDVRKLIKVVAPRLWMLVIGGILIAVMFLIWMFTGVMASYVTGTGVYHPGASEHGEILCFMPISTGKAVDTGMKVSCYPVGVDRQKYGHMNATVTYVDPYVTSVDEIRELLGDDSLVNTYTQSGPVVLIVCEPEMDATSNNGYKWTNEKGDKVELKDGSFISLSITTNTMTPFEYFTK